MKWIPVKQQLPKDCEAVLIYDYFRLEYGLLPFCIAKIINRNDNDYYFECACYSPFTHIDIQYWMPLPSDPPKDSE